LAKKQQPTDTAESDSRKAEQLSRIRAWTERDEPKPDEDAQPKDAQDAA
jgi:hypothetical protein